MNSFDWQTALWKVPNTLDGWWVWGCAIIALLAAILMFLRTVLREDWNLLTFFRAMYTFGLFTIFLSAMNSGWQRWSEPFFAVSGLGMALIYFFDFHRTRHPGRSLVHLFWDRRPRPFGGMRRSFFDENLR